MMDMEDGPQAGGISIHAVDVATGRAAEGMAVTLRRLAPAPAELATGRIGANGLLDHPSAAGAGIVAGLYEVSFDVGAFLAGQGRDAGFLAVVPFRFQIVDAAQHCHLPFKFTPFGIALFRGV